jgi:hypothetical protein
MIRLSPKAHAEILQNRCAEAFGPRSGISVDEVRGPYGEAGYIFTLTGEGEFEFRGRRVTEVLWKATVHVTKDHQVYIEEDKRNDEPVPRAALACATEALTGFDYKRFVRD